MSETSLDLEFTSIGSVTIATIVNAKMLDATNVLSFGEIAIDYAQTHENVNLLVNFEHIQYMSSAGLTELLRINDALKPQGGTVHLWGLNKDIYNVFRITNLDTLFIIHTSTTLDAAVAEFSTTLDSGSPTEPEAIQPGTGQ